MEEEDEDFESISIQKQPLLFPSVTCYGSIQQDSHERNGKYTILKLPC